MIDYYHLMSYITFCNLHIIFYTVNVNLFIIIAMLMLCLLIFIIHYIILFIRCYCTINRRYSSKEVLRSKLLYAIHNCAAIDGDDTGAGMRAAALGIET